MWLSHKEGWEFHSNSAVSYFDYSVSGEGSLQPKGLHATLCRKETLGLLVTPWRVLAASRSRELGGVGFYWAAQDKDCSPSSSLRESRRKTPVAVALKENERLFGDGAVGIVSLRAFMETLPSFNRLKIYYRLLV